MNIDLGIGPAFAPLVESDWLGHTVTDRVGRRGVVRRASQVDTAQIAILSTVAPDPEACPIWDERLVLLARDIERAAFSDYRQQLDEVGELEILLRRGRRTERPALSSCADRAMAWLRRRTRQTVGLVAVASAALALCACGTVGSGDGGSGDREAKYKRVIEDPHPRPADVIEAAGAPTGVVRADDGSLLLTYDAGNVEDDEGPAATAWRIVGPDGRTVAEQAEHADAEAVPPAFKGVPGGFVRVPPGDTAEGTYSLDVRGKRHKVVVTETPLRTRPGDILLAELEPTLVYRPATRTVAPPAGVPDDAVRVAVDQQGTVWSLNQPLTEDPNSVVRQRDSRTLGSTAVPKPYSGGILAARGGTAALPHTQGERVRGLLVTTDSGEHWRTVLAGGIPWGDLKGWPGVAGPGTAHGRAAVGR